MRTHPRERREAGPDSAGTANGETIMARYYRDPDDDNYEDYDSEEDLRDDFADPGGNSALRAASKTNPRNLPCPTCGEPNRLTPKDRSLGYQCDSCADADEGMGY